MKKVLVSGLAILCLLGGIGGLRASAEIGSDETIVADIPYDFVVRDQTLPAGKYTIKVADDTNLNMLVLRGVTDKKAVFFQTDVVQAKETPRHTELVFDKVGDTYFLSRIWLRGSNEGDEVEKTRAERKLEAEGRMPESHSVMAQEQGSKSSK